MGVQTFADLRFDPLRPAVDRLRSAARGRGRDALARVWAIWLAALVRLRVASLALARRVRVDDRVSPILLLVFRLRARTPLRAPRSRRDRRFAPIFLLGSCLFWSLFAFGQTATSSAEQRIEAFVREGCPHCAKAEEFLQRLAKEKPGLEIVVRDVQKEPAALERLKELARQTNAGAARVPAIFVGGQLIIGYSEEANTDKLIRAALAGSSAKTATTAHENACAAEEGAAECKPGADEPEAEPEQFQLTMFGRTLTLEDVGLPLFTFTMGLLDGLNPCSMWVLLLMISLLAPLNDRRRMAAIAGTFVVVEGIAYFLFMAAWLNLFLLIGLSRASQLIIAAIAIVAGLINVKDFVAFGQGISLGIPEKAKPGIYQRMRGLLHAPTMTAAIVGAAVLAVLVQVVEFLCTSGFPALFTRILTLRQLDTTSYYGYLLLYNAAYMLDDIIVLTIGVVMLSRHRLQEKEGRVLKLLSGLVMIALGLYLAFVA